MLNSATAFIVRLPQDHEVWSAVCGELVPAAEGLVVMCSRPVIREVRHGYASVLQPFSA